jgi:ribosomal protein L19
MIKFKICVKIKKVIQLTELIIEKIENSDIVKHHEKIQKAIREDLPDFRVGDEVKVDVKLTKEKEKDTSFRRYVTAIKGSGISKNFIVRKLSAGVGVEIEHSL